MALTKVSPGLLNAEAQAQGFRNRIINGDMRIDQRNAGASVTPTNGQFLVDRFNAYVPQASKFTSQQSSTAPVGFTNSLLITSSSAYTVGTSESFAFQQVIEGYNIADLNWGTANAKTVTLSFWVRSSLTGTFGGALQNYASDRSYPFSYTISTADTWEQKSITIAGDTTGTWLTTNSGGIAIIFSIGTGSTKSGTAGSWSSTYYTSATGATSVVGTSGATFYITGVQLEVGSVATEFERRPYGTELALCQRYYYKLLSKNSAYGAGLGVFTYYSGTNINTTVRFPVTMRTGPSLDMGSGTGYYYIDNTWNAQSFNGFTLTYAKPDGCVIYTAVTGGTAGYSTGVLPINANAYIGFSAEL